MSEGDACTSGCGWCGRCERVGPFNASCSDCGTDFWKGADDVGNLCDTCCDRRDAHLDALEIRMAKAEIVTSLQSVDTNQQNVECPVVVEVALVPVDPAKAGPVVEVVLVPHPPGYLAWLDGLRANAHYGSDALARAWYVSPIEYHQHLIAVAPDLWLTLKAIARRVA